MAYIFGKDITYTFYAIEDRDAIDMSGVTTSPAIYVYKSNYKPDRTQAAAGTDNGGLVGSAITTWTATTRGNGKYFTIPAIDDPDPTSSIDTYTYWLAINFYLKNSEQKQTLIRALPMRRVSAHHKAIDVRNEDLEAIYPGVTTNIVSSANAVAVIGHAITMTELDLDAKGFEYANLWRPDRLNEAVQYRALAEIMLQNMVATDDEWHTLYKEYKDVSNNIVRNLKIEYTTSAGAEDDNIKETRGGGVVRFIR